MPHEVGQGRTGGEKAGEVAAGRGLVIKANFFSGMAANSMLAGVRPVHGHAKRDQSRRVIEIDLKSILFSHFII